jgi:hypothetical protein
MSFYPDVSPGDPFKPNAKLSNDVRRLVNMSHGFQDCRQKSVPHGSVRVSVYNASTVSIPINSAVIFTTDALHGDVLPVKKAPAGTTEFGIVQKTLAPNECGSCLLIGIATVTLGSGSGNFVKPSSTKAFTRTSSGTAKILYSTGTTGVILLGGSQPQAAPPQIVSGYAGAFKVSLDGTTATIFNGADLNDTNAGTVRIGSKTFDVPSATVEVAPSKKIYIEVSYDSETAEYSMGFITNLSQYADRWPQYWYKELASVDAEGVLHQTHLCGNIEITGRWCS